MFRTDLKVCADIADALAEAWGLKKIVMIRNNQDSAPVLHLNGDTLYARIHLGKPVNVVDEFFLQDGHWYRLYRKTTLQYRYSAEDDIAPVFYAKVFRAKEDIEAYHLESAMVAGALNAGIIGPECLVGADEFDEYKIYAWVGGQVYGKVERIAGKLYFRASGDTCSYQGVQLIMLTPDDRFIPVPDVSPAEMVKYDRSYSPWSNVRELEKWNA